MATKQQLDEYYSAENQRKIREAQRERSRKKKLEKDIEDVEKDPIRRGYGGLKKLSDALKKLPAK